MSTTTEKPSLLDTLKAQAAELSAKIKAETDKHLETLHAKLKEAHVLVSNLTAQIQEHSGKPAPAKRGRKPGSVNKKAAPAAKRGRKPKGKRGAISEGILKYLSTKGKTGAHVKDIAAAIGSKPANVTAFMYSAKGKKTCKNLGKATFALKG